MQLVCPEMEVFLELHKNQLESSGVSKIFWQPLERKLRQQTLDAGRSLALMRFDYEDRERGPREPPFANVVTAEDGLSDSDPDNIFLIDHAWTFRPNIAKVRFSLGFLKKNVTY
jgi:tubulin--tyrosine ligase-like protein 12